MEPNDKAFSPPYNVPFATIITTIEKVGADLPNRLDRSYLGSASGGLKSYIISAFRGFDLIHEDLTVSDRLKTLATNPADRPAMVGEILAAYYPKAVALGTTNSTPGELDAAFAEMFPSVNGESRVKAIRFFLSAMDYAQIPKSPLWKLPKAGTSGSRKKGPRPKPPAFGTGSGGTGGQTPDSSTLSKSLRSFALPSGRTLTISLDGDVMTLERIERKFVMEIIDKIEEHIESAPGPGGSS